MSTQTIQKDAVLSDCGQYRYRLTRFWNADLPRVLWIMLNPSLADAAKDDPTIRRCVGFARTWTKKHLGDGTAETVAFGGIEVVNLFPLRSPYPEALQVSPAPFGEWEGKPPRLVNDRHLIEAATNPANGIVVCAWGDHGKFHNQGTEVMRLLADHVDLYVCARHDHVRGGMVQQVTKSGNARHPLYLGGDCEPWRYQLKTRDLTHLAKGAEKAL